MSTARRRFSGHRRRAGSSIQRTLGVPLHQAMGCLPKMEGGVGESIVQLLRRTHALLCVVSRARILRMNDREMAVSLEFQWGQPRNETVITRVKRVATVTVSAPDPTRHLNSMIVRESRWRSRISTDSTRNWPWTFSTLETSKTFIRFLL